MIPFTGVLATIIIMDIRNKLMLGAYMSARKRNTFYEFKESIQ